MLLFTVLIMILFRCLTAVNHGRLAKVHHFVVMDVSGGGVVNALSPVVYIMDVLPQANMHPNSYYLLHILELMYLQKKSSTSSNALHFLFCEVLRTWEDLKLCIFPLRTPLVLIFFSSVYNVIPHQVMSVFNYPVQTFLKLAADQKWICV